MKGMNLPPFLVVGIFLLFGAATAAFSADLYFRPDGAAPASGEIYPWDTTTPSWYTALNGGSATVWNNDTPDIAYIPLTGSPFTIELVSDISVGGIYSATGQTANLPTTFRSSDIDNPVTLTFAPGAILQNSQGTNRQFTFSNMNIAGDFTVAGSGRSNFHGITFTGKIATSSGNIGLAGVTNADIVADGGAVVLNGPTATYSKLSGAGGSINRSSAGSGGALTLDQADNSSWGGALMHGSGQAYSFTKSGAGTFVMNGDQSHTLDGSVNASGGAFYLSGSIVAGGTHTVAAGATFGGTVVTSKTLILGAANSIVTPGMATLDLSENVENHAGVLTLASGITGANGGTFNFFMDEDEGGLVNSLIDVTGGTVTLTGTKTVNLFGLNAGLLQTGVAYTLFDAGGAAALTAGWDLGWTLNGNTTGLDVESFGFVGNELQVVFVPEPTTWLLMAVGLLALACSRNRRIQV